MHRLDPRAKLIAALSLTLVIIARGDLLRLGAIACMMLALIIGNCFTRAWLKLLRGLVWIVALTLALTWFAVDADAAVLTALRFVTLTAVFFVFFQSTRPEDLGNCLVQWRVPYPFAFILTGGMQFAPVMARR
ncbi:MAG: energy-coupling factor transporter transmembrane protein EcfT, partial [Chloroflexi bacterium]|nr:energy-coupling factor transporter transmembrane protein EcfT [Chloroflexota bacterium]